MGVVVKLIDFTLFLFFLAVAVAAPLLDAQICFPLAHFPELLVEFKKWYISEFGYYLIVEKPHFFVGLAWLEFLFQWPLALLSLYAILAGKPWFKTTCLIYGASFSTSLVAILSELMRSERASDKLLKTYVTFMGLGVLATVRGLLPHSAVGKRPATMFRKKRV